MSESTTRVVLVGGGHAHALVLEAFASRPLEGAQLTVVADRPVAVYSGMVPGFVAGQYDAQALEIDVPALAARAGARFVCGAVTRVDAAARRLEVAGVGPLDYDLASLNIGSTVAGLDVPGAREHVLATRPIGDFVARIDALVAAATERGEPLRIAVVGGGAAGVEVAFALEARLRPCGAALTIVDHRPRILSSAPARLVARVLRRASERGIEVVSGQRVAAVEAGSLRLADGSARAHDLVVWATGATSHPVLAESGLPVDARGFVRVGADLRVEGHPELFAVGDCASLVAHPSTPKAGVYAVREGPVLTRSLRAVLAGRPPERYRPQSDFLALLNLGDGTAIGAKWGWVVEGAWVMRLKDRIDRGFMRRFAVEARPVA